MLWFVVNVVMAGLLEIIMCINVLSEAGLGWAGLGWAGLGSSYRAAVISAQDCAQPRQANLIVHTTPTFQPSY